MVLLENKYNFFYKFIILLSFLSSTALKYLENVNKQVNLIFYHILVKMYFLYNFHDI